MLVEFLLLIVLGFLTILIIPARYNSFSYIVACFYALSVASYSVLLLVNFDFYLAQFQYIIEIKFFLGLIPPTLLIVEVTMMYGFICLNIFWGEIKNKNVLISMCALQFFMVFGWSFLFVPY